jgi:hypothetical protein
LKANKRHCAFDSLIFLKSSISPNGMNRITESSACCFAHSNPGPRPQHEAKTTSNHASCIPFWIENKAAFSAGCLKSDQHQGGVDGCALLNPIDLRRNAPHHMLVENSAVQHIDDALRIVGVCG